MPTRSWQRPATACPSPVCVRHAQAGEYLAAIYQPYRHATTREKGRMLKEFGRATG